MAKKNDADTIAELPPEVAPVAAQATTIALFSTNSDGAKYHAAETVKHLTELGVAARIVDSGGGTSTVQVLL